MAYHLSVFLENKPGKLERITRLVADAGVNLRAIAVASKGEFGVLKILVDDPDKALAALVAAHVTAHKRSVAVAVVEDRPGGFAALLGALSAGGVNVEDCYGFVLEDKKKAAIVIDAEHLPETEAVLRAAGYAVLADDDVYRL